MPSQDITINATAAFAQAALTAGAFALLRRYVPAKDPGVDPETLATLRKKYAWFELSGLLPLFAIVAGITWLVYVGLRRADALLAVRREAAEFVLRPDAIALLIPAMFLAMILSAVPMGLLIRLLIGAERYREYAVVARYGQGYDAVRAFALLAALIVPTALALAGLLMDQYTLATPSELVIDPFWGLTQHRRPYAAVVAVYQVDNFTAPSGKVIAKSYHIVRFRDGSTWSTGDGLRTPRPASDEPMVGYVADRAGVGVQRVRSLPPPG